MEPLLESKRRFFKELERLEQAEESDEDGLVDDDETAQQRFRWECAFKGGIPTSKATTPRAPLPPPPEYHETREQQHSPAQQTRFVSAEPISDAESVAQVVVERTPLTEIKRFLGKDTPISDGPSHPPGDTPIPDSARAPLQPIPVSRTTSASNPLAKLLFPHRQQQQGPPSQSDKTKKRKASTSSTVKLAPQDQQVLKGLKLYYIPPDDVASARKRRIRKAQEYGAEWTKDLRSASHVVVDDRLTWEGIKDTLSALDDVDSVVLVKENYPLECIQYGALLNHRQRQYRVAGCPHSLNATEAHSATAEVTAEAMASYHSLPLKPRASDPRRWDHVPAPDTPTPDEESSGGRDGRGANPSSVATQLDNITVPQSHPAAVPTRGVHEDKPGTYHAAPSDELSDCVAQMLKFKDLPLDTDDDDDTGSVADNDGQPSDSEGGSEEDERSHKRQRTAKSSRKNVQWEERFACNQGGTYDGNGGEGGNGGQNPNARTIEVLQQMSDYYTRVMDTWRSRGYRLAISTLKRQAKKITTAEEARTLPHIGYRIADKIEEIVTTDSLRRLENAEKEPVDETLQLFLKIYGVGYAQASRWVAQGLRILDDLREKAKLSINQRIGVDHFDDLNTRIPRREVEALGDIVKAQAARLDPEAELIIGGSYRRGSTSSGDIDFIVTKKGTTCGADLHHFLRKLTGALEAQGFLTARLASSRDKGGTKWHGCCVLPKIAGLNDQNYRPVWRRIDFLVVPETEMGAALIYFTGNDIFNRSMRLLAARKGMRLNHRGLYKDVVRGPGRVKMTEGELIEGRDEKRIFEILGVQWREPTQRWC